MEHNIVVYFADKSVVFAREVSSGDALRFAPADCGAISRDKIVNFLETRNSVAVVVPDPQAAFERFAQDFTLVQAAGGVVVDPQGRRLMIHRNGRWDLPKGHVEPGESVAACAAREILEETGVEAEVEAPLCATWHAYWFGKTERWELKRTHWFLLRTSGCDTLAPQTEEGIDRVAWCDAGTFVSNLRGAFPTVRRVGEAMAENPGFGCSASVGAGPCPGRRTAEK
ncbi:MAG: NUDIX hydrolase [Alistipes sp.]|nr:NUDIX hydrolase [Alistipes sp.]